MPSFCLCQSQNRGLSVSKNRGTSCWIDTTCFPAVVARGTLVYVLYTGLMYTNQRGLPVHHLNRKHSLIHRFNGLLTWLAHLWICNKQMVDGLTDIRTQVQKQTLLDTVCTVHIHHKLTSPFSNVTLFTFSNSTAMLSLSFLISEINTIYAKFASFVILCILCKTKVKIGQSYSQSTFIWGCLRWFLNISTSADSLEANIPSSVENMQWSATVHNDWPGHHTK